MRLFTVLEILGYMSNLQPVVIGNVYYLTNSDRADSLQQKANREMFGEPASPPNLPWGGFGGGQGGFGGGLGGVGPQPGGLVGGGGFAAPQPSGSPPLGGVPPGVAPAPKKD